MVSSGRTETESTESLFCKVGDTIGGGLSRVPVGPRPRVSVTGLASFLAAINSDACSVRDKVRLKALRIPNPCKIIRTSARSEAI